MNSASDIETDTLTAVDETERAVIMVCLQNPADREVIDRFLSERFELIFSDCTLRENGFDLCITDRETLATHREDVTSYKDSKAPIFTPFILLEKDPSWSRQSDPLVDIVDDVVPIPVSPGVLISRIEIQLKSREYSLKLQHKNEKLQAEKEKYRLITENATDMVVINKPDGTFTYVSPASENLTGYRPEELIGRSFYEFFHPNDLETLKHTREMFMNDSDVHKVAYRFKTKGGDYTWVESGVRAIRDPESGEVVEIQGAVRDISDRKEYEQKLEEEKERYRLITENSNDMVTLHAPDATYRYVSPSSERLIGYKPEELVGKSPFENMHPEDREAYFEDEQELFDDSDEFGMTFRKKTKQGDYIWVETRMRPIRDEKTGEILEIQASTRDISERMKYEQKLESEKEFNDTVISSMPTLFYVIDEDMNLVRWNKKMEYKLGYSNEELQNMSPLEMYKEEDRPMVTDKIQEVLETGEAEMTADIIPKEGPVQHHFISGRKFTKNGKTYIVGTGIDLTDQFRTLGELRERIKEQTCLYNIAKLNGRPETVEELLDEAVSYLPDGWQYPEITEAAIEFDGRRYATSGYRDSDWTLVNDRKEIEGKPITVKVVYLEEKPEMDEGPFIIEERKLIDAIADTLASQIQRITAQKKLKESEQRWEGLVQNDPNLIQISTAEGTIKYVNGAGACMYGVDNPESLIGKNIFDLLETDDADIIKYRMQRVLRGEEVPPRIYTMTALDGKTRHVEVQAVPIRLDNGELGLQQVGQDLTTRIEYEQQLKKSLEEKQVLLQEVHHRVKNNLAVVSGLLQIQRFNSEDEKINKVLTGSEMRIKSMALIHETLYQSNSLSDIDFKSYIEGLSEKIENTVDTRSDITVDVRCESIPINVNQAVPCALIINELVSNAYEHAFVDGKEGRIQIDIKENDNRIRISVKDNGVGVPDGILESDNLSMGYTIVKTLIAQLEAELDIQNDEGTTVSFSFQKKALRGSSSSLVG